MSRAIAMMLLSAYIVGWTVLAATAVGSSKTSGEEVTWAFPLSFFLLLLAPALLGYIAGIDDSE